MQVVEIKISVYITDDIIVGGIDSVEDYINNQLHENPEFFGYIDQGCINVTDEKEPE